MPIRHIATLREGKGDEESLKVIESKGLPAWEVDANFTVVGQRHTRLEGADKVTGRAQYSYDIQLPGQLYARVLRSPHPHARVVSIDASQAEALPGVHAVLTLANTPDIDWYEEKARLFDSTVRFVGDEVAAVAADSEEIAEDALRLIQVTYEPLPFVIDMEAALEPGAPQIHPGNEYGNLSSEPKVYERGDVEAGLREADVIIEHEYRTEVALHNSFEPHGCTAHWHGNQLTLWESTQGIFEVREMVAEKVGLPEHHVRVIKHHMGGGFGAKQVAWKQTVIAALLSKKSGRPVQLMLDREAENLAAGNRNATIQHIRLGAKRDGTLTAIYCDNKQTTGAYRVGGEGSNVSGPYERLYQCANVYTKQSAIYINAGPSVAFRAPGFVEGAFGLESAMDELARELNMDPVELRRLNAVAPGDPFIVTADEPGDLGYGDSYGLDQCLDLVDEALASGRGEPAPEGWPTGRGVAMAMIATIPPRGHHANVSVAIDPAGVYTVSVGTAEFGNGTTTVHVQLVATELGTTPDRVRVRQSDTASSGYDTGAFGSAGSVVAGKAVHLAAERLHAELLTLAARAAGIATGDCRIARDGVVLPDGRLIPFAEIVPDGLSADGSHDGTPRSVAFNVHGFRVAVDPETGEVRILQSVQAVDAGVVIHPEQLRGQVEGGVAQAIGTALQEEIVVEEGEVLTRTFRNYRVPQMADIPFTEVLFADTVDALGPRGAKSMSEAPYNPVAPALANAITDALGVRPTRLPMTRDRVWRLARSVNGAGGRRSS